MLPAAITGRSPPSARQLLLVNLLTDLASAMTIALRAPLSHRAAPPMPSPQPPRPVPPGPLLQALLIHRLLPPGFTNRDLRTLLAPLLGTTTEDITAGKMTYDLRRLRADSLIGRIPHIRRYQLTDTGLHHALLFTHAHDHLMRTGLAELTDPDPPAPSRLRAAARAYQAAFHDLAQRAHLAA